MSRLQLSLAVLFFLAAVALSAWETSKLTIAPFFLAGPIYEDIQVIWRALDVSQKRVIQIAFVIAGIYAMLALFVKLGFNALLGLLHFVSTYAAYFLMDRPSPLELSGGWALYPPLHGLENTRVSAPLVQTEAGNIVTAISVALFAMTLFEAIARRIRNRKDLLDANERSNHFS